MSRLIAGPSSLPGQEWAPTHLFHSRPPHSRTEVASWARFTWPGPPLPVAELVLPRLVAVDCMSFLVCQNPAFSGEKLMPAGT
jgi:hypothetical protein